MTEPDVELDKLFSPEEQERLREAEQARKAKREAALAASGRPFDKVREQYGDEAFQPHDVVPADVRASPLSERQESLIADVPGPSKPKGQPTHQFERVQIDEAVRGKRLTMGMRDTDTVRRLPAIPMTDEITDVSMGAGSSVASQPGDVPRGSRRRFTMAIFLGALIAGVFVLVMALRASHGPNADDAHAADEAVANAPVRKTSAASMSATSTSHAQATAAPGAVEPADTSVATAGTNAVAGPASPEPNAPLSPSPKPASAKKNPPPFPAAATTAASPAAPPKAPPPKAPPAATTTTKAASPPKLPSHGTFDD